MELNEKFFRLAKRGDVEKIYEDIKDYLEDVSPEEAKKCIRDFIEDAEYASGVVSATNKAYQDVILAILENEKVNILELATTGMDAAVELLNRYGIDAPRGEPRPYSFYRRKEDSSTLKVFLHITDGRQCYELNVLQCMSETIAQLPPNIYVRPQRIPGVIVENEAILGLYSGDRRKSSPYWADSAKSPAKLHSSSMTALTMFTSFSGNLLEETRRKRTGCWRGW
ncbi:MAG: hypothetical protein QXR45_08685 [Candidatus Bathyarchaeia archaeon]